MEGRGSSYLILFRFRGYVVIFHEARTFKRNRIFLLTVLTPRVIEKDVNVIHLNESTRSLKMMKRLEFTI